MALDAKAEAALALFRFGLGPRAGSIAAIASDPRGALLAELDGAGIRRNARDRSGAWTEAEPVQGERGLRFRIKGHPSSSFRPGPDATPRQQHRPRPQVKFAAGRLSQSWP